MTNADLKHALISLLLGVLTMASMQLLNGLIHILQQWVVAGTGGAMSTVSYLYNKHLI